MKPAIFKLALWTLLALPAVTALAQVKYDEDGKIQNAEIEVIKDKKIELPASERKFEKIGTPAPAPARNQSAYDYSERNFRPGDLKFTPRILQLPQEPLPQLYGNYLKVGGGNYATFYGEGYLNTKRTDDFAYGLRFRHRSSQTGPVERLNSGTSQNMLGFYGKYFTEYATLSADVQYNRDMAHFYAIPVPQDRREDIRQVYSTLAFEGRIANAKKDAPLDYDLTARFVNFSDRLFSARENDFGLQFKGGFAVNDELRVSLLTDFFFTSRQGLRGQQNRNFTRLRPMFYFNVNAFSVRLGLNAVFENDTLRTAKAFHLYPTAEASYQLAPIATAFAGIDGDMQRTTLRQFAGLNPWLVADVPLAHTNKLLEFYGGLRGRVNREFNYEVKVSQTNYRNLWFFNNAGALGTFGDTARFTILYNPDVTGVLNLSVQGGYRVTGAFESSLQLDFFAYTVGRNFRTAFHRPTTTVTWTNRLLVKDKVRFEANFYYLGGIQARNPVFDRLVTLAAVVDLNLKAEYLFSRNFSAFLAVNNVFGQQYQRYLYYPQQGLNVLGGITYAF